MRLYFDEHLNLLDHQALKAYRSKLKKPDRYLITKSYDTQAYTQLRKYGLENKVINMYDYFQNTINMPIRDLHVRLSGIFNLKDFKIVGINNNQSDLYDRNTKIAEIKIAPETVQLIGDVNFVNDAGLTTSRDLYDRRGFLSSTQYFDLNGNLGHQIIYNKDKQPVIEIIVMNYNGKLQKTGLKLLNYQGADYLFANEDNLWTFFKDELKQINIAKLRK